MKSSIFLLTGTLARSGFGAALNPRDDPPAGEGPALEPKYFADLGAKRVKISYGPYLVPGSGDELTGGMTAFDDPDAPMPCSDCLITGFLPNLEYEDGTTANVNTGMMLHHSVLANMNRTDATCEDSPDRFIGAGNERTVFDLTLKGTRKAGYYIMEGDQIYITTELMNSSPDPQTVYFTAEWEFLPSVPEDFDFAVPLWLDVTGTCGTSEVTVPDEEVFNVTMSPEWSPKFTGDLYTMLGHLHDGGIKQDVFMDGKQICESVVNYGESEEYISGGNMSMPGHDHEKRQSMSAAMVHLSSITTCTNIGKIGPENKFSITAFYNMTEHPGMGAHGGGLQPVMGIEFLHVARPQQEVMKEILASNRSSIGWR